MANPLKQLAGQTVIYGLSTILARIINFLFVPIYTRLLTPESYGVVTEFMAYIAVLQVVLVLGLETGCFRFANKEGVDPHLLSGPRTVHFPALSSLSCGPRPLSASVHQPSSHCNNSGIPWALAHTELVQFQGREEAPCKTRRNTVEPLK